MLAKVNLHHIINFRGAELVTLRSKLRDNETLVLHRPENAARSIPCCLALAFRQGLGFGG